MSNPYLNPEAIGRLGPEFSEAENRQHKTEAMLLRADDLLSDANMHDALHSWSRNIGSNKVVPNCSELPFGFSRMRMMPNISDKPEIDGMTELVDRDYVKLPSNVLFGVKELYLFVPEEATDIFREPDIRTPIAVAIVTFGINRNNRTFLLTGEGVFEFSRLGELSKAIAEGLVSEGVLGVPVPGEDFEELHRILFDSTVVDQDGREPLADD